MIVTLVLLVLLVPLFWRNSLAGDLLVKCEKTRRNCTCPMDPVTERYPDSSDSTCEQYFLCHMGNAFLRRCNVRTVFHAEEKECLPRSRVPYNSCPVAVNCDTDGYKEDPKECTMYYMCFYKQAYHYGCKADHYFNKDKGLCVKDKAKVRNCEGRKGPSASANSLRKRYLTDSQELPLLRTFYDVEQSSEESSEEQEKEQDFYV